MGTTGIGIDQVRIGQWSVSALTDFRIATMIRWHVFQPSRSYRDSAAPMKEQYVNAFLFPAMLVWESELNTDLSFVGATPCSDSETMTDVSALVRVSGDLIGWVSYEFRNEDALRVVSLMLTERVFELDELGRSALGEMANMITGNAAAALEQAGFTCELKPPEFFSGVGREFPPTPAEVQIKAEFTSSVGSLAVRIALGETALGEIAA